jgi:hypothetical protein
VRRGDEKTATVLAFQDELTEAGLLPHPSGDGRRRVRRLEPLKAVPPGCGTEAAFWRHVDRCEECQQCEDAHQAASERTGPWAADLDELIAVLAEALRKHGTEAAA